MYSQVVPSQSSVVDILNTKITNLIPSVIEFAGNFFIALVVFLLGFVMILIVRWIVLTILQKK